MLFAGVRNMECRVSGTTECIYYVKDFHKLFFTSLSDFIISLPNHSNCFVYQYCDTVTHSKTDEKSYCYCLFKQ